MKKQAPVIDNLTDVLHLIIQFTHARRSLLVQNIQQVASKDYTPMDLPAQFFADMLNQALTEHVRRNRLLWRDTNWITFGTGASVTFTAQSDERASCLQKGDPDAYLHYQIRLLLENEINQKVANRLLAHRLAKPATTLH